jgi:hypothetical protein
MSLDFTLNICYDERKDVYFINGSHSEVNEKKKSLIDPFALWVRVLDFSSQHFQDLGDLISQIKSMEMRYVIRNRRPSDKQKIV